MKPIYSIIIVFVILYIIKVPGVVSFIDNLMTPVHAVINYTIDTATHIRERHPFIYIAMWFLLLFLMRPEYDSYSFKGK